MLDTMTVAENLRAAGLTEKQARAVASVMHMTHRSDGADLDTQKITDILREAGFDEAKTRALVYTQEEARKAMLEARRVPKPEFPWYLRIRGRHA